MKSDIINLSGTSKNTDSLSTVLSETEKAASYANLDKKEGGRLRLLAEELIGMLPELLDFSKGTFWLDCNGKNIELHTVLSPEESMTSKKRDELLKVSKSGKNAAAKGIMSKIKLAATFMLLDYDDVMKYAPQIYNDAYIYLGTTKNTELVSWSLANYRHNAEEKKGEPWDELEKSIIANIADDVLVSVDGKKVEIIVKKAF